MTATPEKQPETLEKSPAEQPKQENKTQDYNLRQIAKALEEERASRKVLEEKLAALQSQKQKAVSSDTDDDEDSDGDPYIDRRKLKKELGKFTGKVKEDTSKEIRAAVQEAIAQERRNSYLKENSDFEQVMQPENIQKFAEKYPRIAENLLQMPDGFDRQKLVYENIKAFRLHEKEASIQKTVDERKRSPYYQPSGVSPGAYESTGDFTDAGQKNAYQKMKQLQKSLRLG